MEWSTKRLTINFYNQWQFTFVNWIDFNLIHASFEFGWYKSTFDLTLGLLGLNIYVGYFWGEFDNGPNKI